jgi:YD repeat-containing protein
VPVHRHFATRKSLNFLALLITAFKTAAVVGFTRLLAHLRGRARVRTSRVQCGAANFSPLRRWRALAAGTALSAAMLLMGPPAAAQAGGAQFVYDPAGRLIQVIGANGASAQYTYDAAGNLLAVTPLSSSTNVVTGFSEVSGPVGGTLTIYGSGFSTICSNNLVYINGVAASVASCTANSLTVTIPSGATTGTVSVTDGNGTVTSSQNFAVSSAQLAPSITGFSPQVGQPGTTVAVTGSNFPTSTSQETAYLNGAAVPIVSTSANAFSFTVPTGGSPGPITLNTPAGSASSASDFFALPANAPLSSLEFTGQATIGGPPITAILNAAGGYGLIAYAANAGQTLSSDATSETFQSCSFGQIFLYGPGWQQLSSSNLCPGASSFTPPQSGTYTLLLIPDSSDTGSLTLQLQNAPVVTASATIGGSPVTLTTTVPGQVSQLTFTATSANQFVSLQIPGATYPPNSCGYFSLYGNGPAPATTDLINPLQVCNSASQLMVLPTAGIYTLTLVPNGTQAVGSITYQLQNPPAVTASATIGGSPVTLTTTVGAELSQLTFTTTTANQIVSLEFVGGTYTVSCGQFGLFVNGPAPATTAVVTNASVCPAAQLITLPTAGTYTITIVPYDPAAVGSVTMQLWNAPPVTGTATIGGSPITLTTTVPAQISVLSFTTTSANQSVTAQISDTYPGSDCAYDEWTIYGPAPSYPQVATGNLCEIGGTATFPTAGTYTIVVVPYGTDTGSITYQLQ